jgi:hypothetical protein
MSKLSKREVEVIVREVVNGIKVFEKNKSEELFNNSTNKEAFLNKIKEIEELEDKLSSLKSEIRDLGDEFKKEELKVYYYGSNNGVRSERGKTFEVELKNAKGGDWGLQLKITDELVLKGINNKIDINTIIEELIEKHK